MTERITWRGSHASARILVDRVNRRDAMSDRGNYFPKAYASADVEIMGVGTIGGELIRNTSMCAVDAYDGLHRLGVDDTLVEVADGWIVERAER